MTSLHFHEKVTSSEHLFYCELYVLIMSIRMSILTVVKCTNLKCVLQSKQAKENSHSVSWMSFAVDTYFMQRGKQGKSVKLPTDSKCWKLSPCILVVSVTCALPGVTAGWSVAIAKWNVNNVKELVVVTDSLPDFILWIHGNKANSKMHQGSYESMCNVYEISWTFWVLQNHKLGNMTFVFHIWCIKTPGVHLSVAGKLAIYDIWGWYAHIYHLQLATCIFNTWLYETPFREPNLHSFSIMCF